MITLDLENMLICRSILKDKLVQELIAASAEPKNLALSHAFAGHLIEKAENNGWSGNLIRAMFLHLLSQRGCWAQKRPKAPKVP